MVVNDDQATDESCPAVSTVGNLDGELDPGEAVTCTAVDYVVTQADIDIGSVTNVATASADGTTSNQDSVTVFAQNLPASINGIVWLDENHDDVNQPGEPLLDNWIVEIYLGATLVDTVLTDAAGYYEITDLTPDSGYRILFRHPTTNIVWGEIDNLTLNAGNTVSDQSLPIDPQGVVYDSVARTTLSGAVLSLVDSAGTALPVACLLDPSQQNQTTAADGFYRFD
ncbi:MAG: hypothetical protein GWM87_09625, partial [Xanthomonadales bacterium]|nr:hypothetical protein [Xanthomonadales bacterium]NIX13161.1 hypothetical protein [Xanthomonadales bacterium]